MLYNFLSEMQEYPIPQLPTSLSFEIKRCWFESETFSIYDFFYHFLYFFVYLFVRFVVVVVFMILRII